MMAIITAIMPTTVKRRRLWPAALETFAKQTCHDARLMVGLDAREASGTAIVAEIRLLAREHRIADRVEVMIVDERTLGGKRNAMCALARTPWIAFWDDDDWHAPRRIEHTVAAIDALRPHSARPAIEIKEPILLGCRTMLIHEIVDPRRRTFTYKWRGGDPPYFVGGLLCFQRRLWEAHKFQDTGPEAGAGDEAWWQLSIPDGAVFRYEFSIDPTMYCAFIHKLNTSNTQAPQGDHNWRQHDESEGSLADLIGKDVLALWEDAHAHVLLDRLVVDGSSVAGVGELLPDRLV